MSSYRESKKQHRLRPTQSRRIRRPHKPEGGKLNDAGLLSARQLPIRTQAHAVCGGEGVALNDRRRRDDQSLGQKRKRSNRAGREPLSNRALTAPLHEAMMDRRRELGNARARRNRPKRAVGYADDAVLITAPARPAEPLRKANAFTRTLIDLPGGPPEQFLVAGGTSRRASIVVAARVSSPGPKLSPWSPPVGRMLA